MVGTNERRKYAPFIGIFLFYSSLFQNKRLFRDYLPSIC